MSDLHSQAIEELHETHRQACKGINRLSDSNKFLMSELLAARKERDDAKVEVELLKKLIGSNERKGMFARLFAGGGKK